MIATRAGRPSRRDFLATIAALVATGACAHRASRSSLAPSALRDEIGVQLYTVRDRLAVDFDATMAEVARIGYKRVEFAGYYDRTPQQIRATLDRLGLTAPSAHVSVDVLRADLAAQIRTAKVIGHEYVSVPMSATLQKQGTLADYRDAAKEFTRWAAQCHDAGLRFAYHNHNWELKPLDGAHTGFDVLLAECDPRLVEFELDLYWAAHAGVDPVALIARHPGRFTMWHVKDLVPAVGAYASLPNVNTGKTMVPVGEGTIDFHPIFAAARTSGLRHFFVEQDNAAAGAGSLAAIRASYGYLRGLVG